MNLNGKNEGRVGKIDFGMALPAEMLHLLGISP